MIKRNYRVRETNDTFWGRDVVISLTKNDIETAMNAIDEILIKESTNFFLHYKSVIVPSVIVPKNLKIPSDVFDTCEYYLPKIKDAASRVFDLNQFRFAVVPGKERGKKTCAFGVFGSMG